MMGEVGQYYFCMKDKQGTLMRPYEFLGVVKEYYILYLGLETSNASVSYSM